MYTVYNVMEKDDGPEYISFENKYAAEKMFFLRRFSKFSEL